MKGQFNIVEILIKLKTQQWIKPQHDIVVHMTHVPSSVKINWKEEKIK